jgi:hypothetical protein
MIGPSKRPIWSRKSVVHIEIYQGRRQRNSRELRIVWEVSQRPNIGDVETGEVEQPGLALAIVRVERYQRFRGRGQIHHFDFSNSR